MECWEPALPPIGIPQSQGSNAQQGFIQHSITPPLRFRLESALDKSAPDIMCSHEHSPAPCLGQASEAIGPNQRSKSSETQS
jgi:hypothetical protein